MSSIGRNRPGTKIRRASRDPASRSGTRVMTDRNKRTEAMLDDQVELAVFNDVLQVDPMHSQRDNYHNEFIRSYHEDRVNSENHVKVGVQ